VHGRLNRAPRFTHRRIKSENAKPRESWAFCLPRDIVNAAYAVEVMMSES